MDIAIPDPYEICPVYETEQFRIRQVQPEDAVDLLDCYSDPEARPLFNSDNCRSDFRLNTLQEMEDIIGSWLAEYQRRAYIRFSVVDKATAKAAGTIEFFCRRGLDGEEQSTGLFRLDLASGYETTGHLYELISIVEERFRDYFEFSGILTKAVPQADQRIHALLKAGYQRAEPVGGTGDRDYYLKKISTSF